eukprot:840528_1
MTGHGIIWSLQTENTLPLYKLNVKEVDIMKNYTWKNREFTYVKCNNYTVLDQDIDSANGQVRQTAYWYCVRPLTDDFVTKINKKSNGFIWAYGEGRFQANRIHAARGWCKTDLYDVSADGNIELENVDNLDTIITDEKFNYTYCLHKQNIIGGQGRS